MKNILIFFGFGILAAFICAVITPEPVGVLMGLVIFGFTAMLGLYSFFMEHLISWRM